MAVQNVKIHLIQMKISTRGVFVVADYEYSQKLSGWVCVCVRARVCARNY